MIVNDEVKYLVRVDGEAAVFVNDKDEAQKTLKAFASHEAKRLKNDWSKVYTEEENNKIVLLKIIFFTRIMVQNSPF